MQGLPDNSISDFSIDEIINKKQITSEIRVAFACYMDAYFYQRNAPKTFDFFDDEITGFGTGADEIAIDSGKFRSLYLRDLTHIPNAIDVIYHQVKIEVLTELTGLVSAVISIKAEVEGSMLEIEGIRISIVFRKKKEKWLILHKHISCPAYSQKEGESFPLMELRKRNEWLEQIIQEKTKDQTVINKKLEEDIKNRIKAEEALKDSENHLRNLNNTKDKLFSIISHDLRSPFHGLLGLSDILATEIDTLGLDKAKHFCKELNSALNKQYDLLTDLLDWARIQSREFVFVAKSINLHLEVSVVLERFYLNASQKKVELRNNVPEDIIVTTDVNVLNLALRNLISNGIKFTEADGCVTVSAEKKDSFVEVVVSDDGVGIHDESIAKLFQSDANFTTRGTANEKGTGMGLFLCKETIEKQGGKVWVESEVGKGSRFVFTIPSK